MLRLLFTGGGGSGTEAIVNLLGDKYDLHFADSQQRNDVIHPVVDRQHQHNIPWAVDACYAREIASLVTALAVDVFIPCVDEELIHIRELQTLLPQLDILAPESDYIDKMMDKKEMAIAMSSMDLPAPGAFSLEAPEKLDYPIIAKPRKGRGSRGVRKLEGPEDVYAYIQLSNSPVDELVAQRYLEGDEYTVMMSANSAGYLQGVVPVLVEEKRGITLRAKVVNDAVVVNSCRDIHARFRTKGCYNIQMLKIDEKTVIPFEINPRVSTTFCLGVAAGIDPIENYYSKSNSDESGVFKENISLKRYWINYIQ